jgi:colicin import membrane protein
LQILNIPVNLFKLINLNTFCEALIVGRVAEYSAEKIIEAGKNIELAGKRVTPFAIREKLGGGSPERIKGIWERHIDKLGESINETSSETIELPYEIQEALDKNRIAASKQLVSFTNNIFKVAKLLAEKRVEPAIDEINKKIEELKEVKQSAFKQIEQLLADNAKLSGQLESFKDRVTQLEDKEVKYEDLQREFGKLEGQLEIFKSKNKR